MRLKISHKTEYSYDAPVAYGLQRLRLMPLSDNAQSVRSWSLTIEGAKEEVRYPDHYGNDTRLVSIDGSPDVITITAEGEIETNETSGVSGPHRGFAPLWLFAAPTALTQPGAGIEALSADARGHNDLERLHMLIQEIREKVDYIPGTTDAATAAEAAFELGSGVCQDHAHIFLAAVRHMGLPARYVSGYLMIDGTTQQAASHAWAEAHIDGLGWVGFDVSNGISPDERYVRLAVGRDYRDAMPVSGIRLGAANERLAVDITVEQ